MMPKLLPRLELDPVPSHPRDVFVVEHDAAFSNRAIIEGAVVL